MVTKGISQPQNLVDLRRPNEVMGLENNLESKNKEIYTLASI